MGPKMLKKIDASWIAALSGFRYGSVVAMDLDDDLIPWICCWRMHIFLRAASIYATSWDWDDLQVMVGLSRFIDIPYVPHVHFLLGLDLQVCLTVIW